jgi:hypothetical protein
MAEDDVTDSSTSEIDLYWVEIKSTRGRGFRKQRPTMTGIKQDWEPEIRPKLEGDIEIIRYLGYELINRSKIRSVYFETTRKDRPFLRVNYEKSMNLE